MIEDEEELVRLIKQDERIAKLEAIDMGLCQECGKGHYHFRGYCGAEVCEECGSHKGLFQCFCGWKQGGGTPEFDEPVDDDDY